MSTSTEVSLGPDQLKKRVERARAAQRDWAKTPLTERLRLLKRLQKRLSDESEAFVKIISHETGKSDLESLSQEIIPVLDALVFLIKKSESILGLEKVDLVTKQFYFKGKLNEIHHDPVGVVGIMGTWNYPFVIGMTQVLFALIAGNGVIFKGAPESERVTDMMRDLLFQSGFSPILFYCFASGPKGGEALCQAGCDKYILTGSRTTGRAVMRELSTGLKPALMELSGCDAYIILSNADWRLAVKTLVWAVFQYSGQTCVAPRRIFITRADRDDFYAALKAEWKACKDFLAEKGMLRTADRASHEKSKILRLKEAGARLEMGEKFKDMDSAFFPPQIYSGASPSMLKDLDFMAPVCFVMECDNEDQILQQVNEHSLGLAASLWTPDAQKARDWAREIQAGQVWVNDSLFSVALPEIPFGGLKDSGFGRTRGREGLLEMTHTKFVSFDQRKKRFESHLPPYRAHSFGVLMGIQKMLYGLGWKSKTIGVLRLLSAFGGRATRNGKPS
jgi:acyl-CoA reductase-like NAD-dependent aldehyde dehydrogenase